jgi:hypothetical protein
MAIQTTVRVKTLLDFLPFSFYDFFIFHFLFDPDPNQELGRITLPVSLRKKVAVPVLINNYIINLTHLA